jgi:hypothetical protein
VAFLYGQILRGDLYLHLPLPLFSLIFFPSRDGEKREVGGFGVERGPFIPPASVIYTLHACSQSAYGDRDYYRRGSPPYIACRSGVPPVVLPNGMFSISDRGATIISFREKGEKRGNGGRRRSKSVPPFFLRHREGEKRGAMGVGTCSRGPNRYQPPK